jgi:hypothetical protein
MTAPCAQPSPHRRQTSHVPPEQQFRRLLVSKTAVIRPRQIVMCSPLRLLVVLPVAIEILFRIVGEVLDAAANFEPCSGLRSERRNRPDG